MVDGGAGGCLFRDDCWRQQQSVVIKDDQRQLELVFFYTVFSIVEQEMVADGWSWSLFCPCCLVVIEQGEKNLHVVSLIELSLLALCAGRIIFFLSVRWFSGVKRFDIC